MIIKDILLQSVEYTGDEKLLENLKLLSKGDSYVKDIHLAENITYVNKNLNACIEFNTVTYNKETGVISAKYKLVHYNNNFYVLLKTDCESFSKSIYSLELYTYTYNKHIGSICFLDTTNEFVFTVSKEDTSNSIYIYTEKNISEILMNILPEIHRYLNKGNTLLLQYNNSNVEQDLKTIFSTNLSYYMYKVGLTCADLSRILNIPYSTVNDWVKGNNYPRMVQLQQLADYFDISKSDLIEQQKDRFYNIYKSYIKEY